MKNYLDLVPISAKVHRKQNRMSIICIVLAVFLVTAIFGMADMFIRGQILQAQQEKGNWHREFVYVGDPVPELNGQEHAAFLMNIQRSIVLSLEKRKLLTPSQRERCLVELEKQYSQNQKKQRRA